MKKDRESTASGAAPWPKVRLGDVCEEIRDRIPSSKVSIANYITTDNMVKERGGVRDAGSVPPDVGLVHYRERDVLVSNIRPYLKKIWLADREGGCSSDVIVFRSKRNDLSSDYLYSALSQDRFFEYSMLNVSGAKMPRGKRDWIKQFEFPLPPLAEQKKIVEKVEKALKRVDALKAQFERMEKSAADYFKAALAETFAAVKGEKMKLGDVCENCDSQRIPITKADRRAGAFPYYGASGVVDHVDQYIFDGDFLLVSEDGANLLARSTPIAFSVSGKIWVNNHAHVLRFESMDTQHYVEYFFASIDIADRVTGAAQPKLTQNALNAILLPIPSLEVQREVVKRLTEIKCTASRLEEAARRCIGICGKMRKAILAEAFQ